MKVWRCPHCGKCNAAYCCPEKAIIVVTTGASSTGREPTDG